MSGQKSKIQPTKQITPVLIRPDTRSGTGVVLQTGTKRPKTEIVSIAAGPAPGSFVTASYLRMNNLRALGSMIQRATSATGARLNYLVGASGASHHGMINAASIAHAVMQPGTTWGGAGQRSHRLLRTEDA